MHATTQAAKGDERVERTPKLVAVALKVSSIVSGYEATIHSRPARVDVDAELAQEIRNAGAGRLLEPLPGFPGCFLVSVAELLRVAGF